MDAIADLRRVVDEVLSFARGGSDELDGDRRELHDALIAVQRERQRLGAVASILLDRWDAQQVWADDGSRTAATRLARDVHTSLDTAKVELRRARRARTMPLTLAAVAEGSLSLDHLDLLGRVNLPWLAEAFAAAEADLVGHCRRLPFADAAKVVRYWRQRVDAAGAARDDQQAIDAAHLHASTTFGGTVVLSGELDPVRGAIVISELERLEREIRLADRRAGVTRTASQRRAAALVEMATRSASTPADGRRPRPLFTVLVGDRTLSELCELVNGTVLTPASLGAYIAEADLETVLFDGPSTVVAVSRARSFVGAVRRAVEVRDRRCRHPSGCDVTADRCDVDHIVPFGHGGPTSQFNGRLECSTHNRRADRHDHDATPQPARLIDRLDEWRARLRWRVMMRAAAADRDAEPPSAAGQD